MAVQLAAVGFVLKFIFAQTSPLWTLLIALVMVLVAGYELVQRQERRFRGWLAYGLGNVTLLLVGGLATLYAVVVVVHPSPWYAPRYVLPDPRHGAPQHPDQLQPGAADADRGRRARAGGDRGPHRSGRVALRGVRPVLRRSLRTAITPLLNMMSVAGIVSLPGMMTGQILAGADPAEAAKYQIMIMFVLTGAAALGALRGRLRRRVAAHRRPPPPSPRPARGRASVVRKRQSPHGPIRQTIPSPAPDPDAATRADRALDRRHLARPLLEGARRRAAHARAGLDVVLDVRHAGDLRAAADLDVADHARMRTHDDEIAELRRAGDAALRHDHAMAADDDVVGDLHEVVDLGALADDRVRRRPGRRWSWRRSRRRRQ